MKALLLAVSIVFFAGCSSKSISVSTPSNANHDVKSAILMYKNAKKSKIVNKYASEELYKASKIAHVLANTTDEKLAGYYATLLKKQVRIAQLTAREYELTNEVNKIVIKRNEAIEDAKHQDDVEEASDDDMDTQEAPEVDTSEIDASFSNGSDGSYIVRGKYFDSDELVLNSKFKALIAHLANELRKNPTKTLQMDSFTDGIGSKAYSIDIALRRAQKIKDELVARGVDEDRIKINPKGAVDFVGSNDTDEGREKNNRIIIKIK